MDAARTTDFHEQMLQDYRVEPDPDGLVRIPGGLLGALLRRWTRLVPRSEAALLHRLNPIRAMRVAVISRDAARECTRRFGGDGFYDGYPDAFRHTYWNARLTQRFGEAWTEQFTTAHERVPAADPVTVAMDLHNNKVGRQIGATHRTAARSALASAVEAAVRGGQTVHIAADGRLRRTGT
ncbi:hypothetical protein AB0F72_27745 [Actinoplanes sp. NPDC023936]|uniref:DUF6973 domain-containing protein n=1 Tax=Actinoplanes sp. NPDC023936 TaxID=3154910 RepID=UPI0034049630